ncbi:hypothetical protein K2173_020076 [Erythroxylum novogranatense]|uniref:Uncharacterized protein n=1 Tax=Erythroxylum novogranatense TaxID=1862640 RepID=A0AAV8U6X7_9ROSI|nr:hypothetical protein K2173_020076 [Erythroxylum novogranatense]
MQHSSINSMASGINEEEEERNEDCEFESSIIKTIAQDDKPGLTSLSNGVSFADRASVSKLLHLCCEFDAVNCASVLVNGDLGAVPLVNEADKFGKTPLHAAAVANAARCVEMLLKKRARADLRTRDERALLPLELALSTLRVGVTWNPDDLCIEDLVVQLNEKDLTTVKLLSEKTKELDQVAYGCAMGGRVVDLAILIKVAAERIKDMLLVLHETDSGSKQETTIYEFVIREALALGQTASSLRAVKKNSSPSRSKSAEKRKLLLREIELLQLFDVVPQNGYTDKKAASPLILASQAGDEAVIELLLKGNTDINDADAEGNTALHWCLKSSKGSSPKHLQIVWLLLKHGARVSQKNKLGLNAVHMAAASGNTEALQVLLLIDPDCINCRTESKETPLFFAVKNDLKDCVELLLRWGASTEVFNLRKQRPIDLAETQDMRFILTSNNISLSNCALSIHQKRTASLQVDEFNSSNCDELLTSGAHGSITKRACSSVKRDVCRYFNSPGGCVRGTDCLYVHDEENPLPAKAKRDVTYSFSRNLEHKVFVGGLPTGLDSGSLGKFFHEQFGSVDEAVVIGTQTGDRIEPRGFGFVTFEDRWSVSAAVEAHYVTIMGKKVEITSVVPKRLLIVQCHKSSHHFEDQNFRHLLQPAIHEEKNTKEIPSCLTCNIKTTKDMQELQAVGEKTIKETSNCKAPGEDKSPILTSWVDKLISGKPKASSVQSQAHNQDIPAWLKTLKRWLPSFLQQVMKSEGEYALSSLKSDFRASFGLELDHASLGFPKLSDFLKSFPDLCRMKYIPIGRQKHANHMILLPSLSKPPLQQPVPLPEPIHSPCSYASSFSNDVDDDSDYSRSSEDLPSVHYERDDLTMSSLKVSQKLSYSSQEESLVTENSRFLEFLKPDPIFRGKQIRPQESHPVLEDLARKQNNRSVFFLREFDFYDKYKTSLEQGKCFGCQQRRLLWANSPCEHLLWCEDCRPKTIWKGSPYEHRCVVCDATVQNLIPADLHTRPPSLKNWVSISTTFEWSMYIVHIMCVSLLFFQQKFKKRFLN